MKYALATLVIFFIGNFSFSQWDLLPNNSFENWSDDTLYEAPTDWVCSNDFEFYGTPTTVKSSDAVDGNYSIRLEATEFANDTLGGYVFHGMLGPSGPEYGIPYSTNFEAFSVHYKCDMDPNDTLYMMMIRYNNGSMVQFLSLPFAFGTNTSWTQQVIFAGTMPQDSLFLGFILNNPLTGQNPAPSSWAMIDNIIMLNGGVPVAPIPNPSFETWDASTTEVPDNWNTLNPYLAPFGIENTVKTTDANTGNYAVQMTTVLASPDSIAGFINLGPIDLYAPWPFGNAPYSGNPLSVSGAYKYAPSGGDQGVLAIQFYQSGAVIGTHYELFSAQSNYTPFISPLSISGTPDSVLVYAYSGDNPGSVLKLDDLQFTGSVGLMDNDLIEMSVYPNPADDHTIVALPEDQEYTVSITSLEGQTIDRRTHVSGNQQFDLAGYNSGYYLILIASEESTVTRRLVIE